MNRVILDSKYIELIQSRGVSARALLRKAALPPQTFSQKQICLTAEEYFRCMDAIADLSADPALPIAVGCSEGIEMFSPPVFAAYCSKNAHVCMERIRRYKKLIGPFSLHLEETPEEFCIDMMMEEKGLDIPWFLVVTELVFMVSLMRKATGVPVIPLAVETRFSLTDPCYTEFFGRPVSQTDRNRLVISMADARLPFISENEAMWEYFEPELVRRLDELEVDVSFPARVRSILVELMPGGDLSVEAVAEQLGYSARSLQRKLNEEKTSYQKQLNHIRELLAKHYLTKLKITNEEIAYLLGYLDTASFLRAFRIWTGMTAAEWKRRNGI